MSQDTKSAPSQSDYKHLLDRSIDELNANQSFEGTSLQRKEQKQKFESKLTKSKYFYVLVLAVLANLGLSLYLHWDKPKRFTLEDAALEIEQAHNGDAAAFKAFYNLMQSETLGSFPSDPKFVSEISDFNSQITQSGGLETPIFQAHEFIAFGEGVYWQSSARDN